MRDGWLIGDGSKIYMCDFYVGHVYCDLFDNPGSWLKQEDKDRILSAAPNFVAYGKRFIAENKTWLEKRKTVIGLKRF